MKKRTASTVKQSQMTTAQEMAVCQGVGNILHNAYPGHIWAVSAEQGVATIQLLFVSGKWGFRMKISDMDTEGKKVLFAGGEILERYGLSRANRKTHVADEMANLKRDFTGEAIRA